MPAAEHVMNPLTVGYSFFGPQVVGVPAPGVLKDVDRFLEMHCSGRFGRVDAEEASKRRAKDSINHVEETETEEEVLL